MLEMELPASKETVQVRGMTVKEIDLLANKKAILSGDAADRLLQDCLLTEDMLVNDLFHTDKNSLLIAIRRATYGDVYEFEIRCPECNTKQVFEINLKELPILEGNRELVDRQLKDKDALHTFQLPSSERKILWNFSTGADLKKAIKIRKTKGDSLASANLILRIKKIEGLAEEGIPIKKFIEDMPAADAEAFAEYYEESEPGFDKKIELCCENGLCGAEFETELPIDPVNFFRRSARKKRS